MNRAYIATRAKVYEGRPRTMADLVAKARLVIEDTRHSPDTDEWGVALAHDILALAGRRR
ncbi:hypothetical protein [Gluconacetobacter johannae]|uniref:Uncharacterized protein n=1 Tax=Gluconacetobacter johannae TaxID=112140 RepID=A0A7W4J9M4_9PROT|nr:hypothetical protein [Gluconacetobacter johannae]MBB2177032.1 hypothetical protein [Gluconacetobacter johannae]